jgi:hypothetical protein
VNFTIAPAFVTLVAPNVPATRWATGTQRTVFWNSNLGLADTVRILLSTDGGATFPVTLAASTPNDGSQTINVPNTPTTTARVRVQRVTNAALGDASDASFEIAAPYIRVTQPNGGQQWTAGSTYRIVWSSNLGTQERVSIDLSTDGGANWQPLAQSTPADGDHLVTLPSVNSATCRVRIIWLENPAVRDRSNADFTIGPP